MSNTFYNLFWGDSLLLGNFTDSAAFVNEIADRQDDPAISVKWFYNAIEINRMLQRKDNGVLLVGTTAPKTVRGVNVPARGYCVIWRTS